MRATRTISFCSALVGLALVGACSTAGTPALVLDRTAAPPPPRAVLATTSVTPTSRSGRYIVRSGDTLSEIAADNRVDMAQLARLNNLAPPYNIRAGQSLVMPGALTAGLAPTGQLPYAPQTIQGQIEILSRSATAAFAAAPAAVTPAIGRAVPPSLRQPTASLPNPPPRSTAGFDWPLSGPVASTFGSKGGGVANDGIDIRAAAGTPVMAVDNGVVAFASNELKALGHLVLIQHAGGWVSAYANAGSIVVERGQTVNRGQQIATAGQSGNAKAAGIHFELRRGTVAVDPLLHLNGVAVGVLAPKLAPLAPR